MKHFHPLLAVVSVSAILVAIATPRAVGQSDQERTGTGHELQQDCTLYFSFLGRTGAGREETYNEDPFGMGYCAGIVRGVANSANTFHPEIDCRLNDFTFVDAVWAVVQYLDRRPQSLGEQDTVLVLRALQLASICSAAPPQ
jgi:hypothetical protein